MSPTVNFSIASKVFGTESSEPTKTQDHDAFNEKSTFGKPVGLKAVANFSSAIDAYGKKYKIELDQKSKDVVADIIKQTTSEHHGNDIEHVVMAAHHMFAKHKDKLTGMVDVDSAIKDFPDRLHMIASQSLLETVSVSQKKGYAHTDDSLSEMIKIAEISRLSHAAHIYKLPNLPDLGGDRHVNWSSMISDIRNHEWSSASGAGDLMLPLATEELNQNVILKRRRYFTNEAGEPDFAERIEVYHSPLPNATNAFAILEEQMRGGKVSGGHFSETNLEGVFHQGEDIINEKLTIGDGRCLARTLLNQKKNDGDLKPDYVRSDVNYLQTRDTAALDTLYGKLADRAQNNPFIRGMYDVDGHD